MGPAVDWKIDRKYNKLIKFLIERTKYSKAPLNINGLAREFMEKSWCSQEEPCLVSRIRKFRSEICQLDSVDMATKVKVLFGLSASIDDNFLNELRKDAHVEVDENNRITKYKANDGRLELDGDHSRSAKHPANNPNIHLKQVAFMNFLIERTKNAKSPLNIKELTREYRERSGSSHERNGWLRKIRLTIHQMDSIDTATKVTMLFALGAPVDKNFLNELQKDADVVVDERNRITKYKANDGSIELEGDHSLSAKSKEGWKQRKMGFQDDSSDDEYQVSTHKTSGSVKRAAAAEVPNPSKRAKDSSPADSMKSKDHAPNDSAGIPESRSSELACEVSPQPSNPKVQQLQQPSKQSEMRNEKSQKDSDDRSEESVPKTPGSVKRAAAAEVPNTSKRAKDYSSENSKKSENHAPNDSAGIPEFGAREQSSPKTPNPGIQSPRQPKVEEVPEAPSSRNVVPQEKSIKTEPETDDGYVSRIKFLETIRSLVFNLDMPILTTLQTRIEKKLRESSPDAKISNDEMSLAMELLVAKITSQSVPNPSENVESVRFSHFLCYLKTAILNSKMECLKGLLEKLNAKIREPISKDKQKMPPKIDWENDPESIEMLKFLIERIKDVKSPLGINTLAREFKEKSGAAQTVPCLNFRIQKLREKAAELDKIDTETKVKMMFALSVSVDTNFLNDSKLCFDPKFLSFRLQKDADVEIDGKNRITKYKANDGSFKLEGDHSHSARNKDGWKHRKRESQGYFVHIFQDSMSTTPGSMKRFAPDDSEKISENPEIQSLRRPELERVLGAKVPKKRSINWKNDSELMNFLIERTRNAKSPLSISQLAGEFKETSGCSQAIPSLTERVRFLRGKIAESDTIDATTKVRMLFALSASIDTGYLKE